MDPKKILQSSEKKYHCTKRARKSGKKSNHNVLNECETVKQVLNLDPERGKVIPGYSDLRKMRVGIPGIGKSGGYRLIYRKVLIDEVIYFLLLETYFKGDKEDLSHHEYDKLHLESEEILKDIQSFEWEEVVPIN